MHTLHIAPSQIAEALTKLISRTGKPSLIYKSFMNASIKAYSKHAKLAIKKTPRTLSDDEWFSVTGSTAVASDYPTKLLLLDETWSSEVASYF